MFFSRPLSKIRKIDLPLNIPIHRAHKSINKALIEHSDHLSPNLKIQLTELLRRVREVNWRMLNHCDDGFNWRESYRYRQAAKESLHALLLLEKILPKEFLDLCSDNPFKNLRDGADALNDRERITSYKI